MIDDYGDLRLHSSDPSTYDYARSLFFAAVHRAQAWRLRTLTVGGDPTPDSLPDGWTVHFDGRSDDTRRTTHLVGVTDRGVRFFIDDGRGQRDAMLAGSDEATVDETLVQLRERFPREPEGPEEGLPITFAFRGRHDVRHVAKRLEAPTWSEIAPNYSASVRDGLERLVETRDPVGGKLVLFHGPPGTGKTYAVRALLREWQGWCAAHYVLDPERLLADPGYLVSLAEDGDRSEGDRKWRILVLEDADEYVSREAKGAMGPGMSRLLNLLDGLLGQGLNLLLLLTTNEDVGKFQPAMVRPGRCLSRVEFGPLSPSEAAEWAARTGRDLSSARAADGALGLRTAGPPGYYLADLFAVPA